MLERGARHRVPSSSVKKLDAGIRYEPLTDDLVAVAGPAEHGDRDAVHGDARADTEHVVVAVRRAERLALAPTGAEAVDETAASRNLIDHVQRDTFDFEEPVAADAWPRLEREHAPRVGRVGQGHELKTVPAPARRACS